MVLAPLLSATEIPSIPSASMTTWPSIWPGGGEAVSAPHPARVTGLVDGRASTIEVRAVASDDQTAPEDIVAGDIESVTGTSWSAISGVSAEPNRIEEGDDPTTTDVTENETTVTVVLGSAAFFAPTDVEITIDGDAGASVVGASTITFQPGVTSMEVQIVADDNAKDDDDDTNTFTVTAKVAETEAEDREVITGTHTVDVDVTDDDESPGQPTLTLTGVASGLDLTIALDDWGSAADATRKYQYRHKIGAADDDTWTDWINVAATATSAEITGLVNGVGYTVELKAVTAAGESTAHSQTQNAGT